MNSFKGLLSRNLLNDEGIGLLNKKSQQFKKISNQSSQIATSILKFFKIYILQIPKILSLLQQEQFIQKQNYYSILRNTYWEIYKQFQNFIVNKIQNQVNQLNNQNNLKFINFTSCIITFQKQIKSYSSSEITLLQMSKKYIKCHKNLLASIQQYKSSFTQAKLIYNIDQKIKRYSICEQNYKNLMQEHELIMQMKEKLQNKKNQLIDTFQSLVQEQEISLNQIEIRTFTFLSKFNKSLCQDIKKRFLISKQGRKSMQKSNIRGFFDGFILQQTDQNNFTNVNNENQVEGRSRRKAGIITENSKIQSINFYQQIKKLIARLQKFIQVRKIQHLQIFDFHFEVYKSAQKKNIAQLKQVLASFEKIQKKIKQQLTKETYQELKTTLNIMQLTMEIYSDVLKKIGPKIQSLSQSTQEMKNILKQIMQDANLIASKVALEQKQRDIIDQQDQKQKIASIIAIIKLADIKLNNLLINMKINYTEIINIYQLGLNDSHDRTYEIGQNSAKTLNALIGSIKLKKLQILRSTIFSELLNKQIKTAIVWEDEAEKINDFKKLKKPTDIQIIDKQKQEPQLSKQQIQRQQCIDDQTEQRQQNSPIKNKNKHLNFLQSKITFIEGEQLRNTFSCALGDKIILQGRLYVTTHRVCFFSSFNPSNVFFGQTFIQIPKKDIITLEKRKNGIFFDNSISITTVKGQVFLTSFFRRNQAFSLISQLIGINRQQQAYQKDQGAFQSDSSEVTEKIPQKLATVSPFTQLKSQQKQQNQQKQDDIKEENIQQRQKQINKILQQTIYNFKTVTIAEFVFPNLTAYKILKILLLDGEISIASQKFKNFLQYFKKIIQLHRDIQISAYTPAINEHLNQTNIKASCPLSFTRKLKSTVPTPNSNIPFLPKFTIASQKHTLYIISKQKWVLDNQVQSSGAPYTDSFRVYFRTICDSNSSRCIIQSKIYINFLKSIMVKGMIETRTHQQSVIQFKKQYDQLRKYLKQIYKQKGKLKIPNQIILKNQRSCPQTSLNHQKIQILNINGKQFNQQQNQAIKQLENKIDQINNKHQHTIQLLNNKIKNYQKFILGLVVLNTMLLILLAF